MTEFLEVADPISSPLAVTSGVIWRYFRLA